VSYKNDVALLAGDLVAVHATDPASVFVGLGARMRQPSVATIEDALYNARAVIRMLAMRRTMFVVPADDVALMHAACTARIAKRERQRLITVIESTGSMSDASRWLRRVEAATMTALAQRGQATAAELGRDVPELRTQIPYGKGKKWEASFSISTRLLTVLAAEGKVVRGRPAGSWLSSQYVWVPAGAWVEPRPSPPTIEAAQNELARRWLRSFGPGTTADLRWWTGWTLTETKRVLGQISVVEVELDDGAPAWVLADDTGPVRPAKPWAALLPALDTTVMGWTHREWYLGPHGKALFDRSGNAGPTVWWDGRVVGGWTQDERGTIRQRVLEDIGKEGTAAVERATARLQSFIGEARVTPRFRTPLELELVANHRG
jgi:hypothetical protein